MEVVDVIIEDIFLKMHFLIKKSDFWRKLMAAPAHTSFRNHASNFLPIFRVDFEARFRCLILRVKGTLHCLHSESNSESSFKICSKYLY